MEAGEKYVVNKSLHKKLIKRLDNLDLIMYIICIETKELYMFIEAVIGSIVGSAFILQNIPGTIETSTNKITTKLSDISDKVDGMNNTLIAMKSKISDIEIEQARMFHAFQWHDLVQTLMAKNAVYIGNNILELKENDSIIQLNLVEKSITETKFGKTYEKKFDGCEYIDGKCVHYKDASCEKWFGFDGNITHEVDSNGDETWYEYDTSNRCIHKKIKHEKDYDEHWNEFDSDGKLIRQRSANKLKGYESVVERFVEYGNVIRMVTKIGDVLSREAYVTKDIGKLELHKFIIGEACTYNEYLIYYKEVITIYGVTNTKEIGGATHEGNALVTHVTHDEANGAIEKDIWIDTNGTIEKGFFNFLTHTYEKRLALAKHKLEEAKSIITNSI